MGQREVAIVHNTDFADGTTGGDPGHASRADVLGAVHDVARALDELGHSVELIPIHEAQGASAALASLLTRLDERRPDLVFNLCESLGGDGRNEIAVPALLDAIGLPYTGSGPVALGLALRKEVTKELLRAAGVPTPRAVVVDSAAHAPPLSSLRLPVIIKPTREDASVGVTSDAVVRAPEAILPRALRLAAELAQPVLVEEYIEGREVYAALLDGAAGLRALPLHEVDFSTMPPELPRIVTYAAKWEPGSVEYRHTPTVRAALPDDVRARCEEVSCAAFRALGLRDYARVDLRLDATTLAPFVIDVNPNCDLSAGAGFARAASYAGLSHTALVGAIVDSALTRRGLTHVRAATVRGS